MGSSWHRRRGEEDRGVRLWDVASGVEYTVPNTKGEWSDAVAFSPDGSTLFAGMGNGVRMWDAASREALLAYPLHRGTVISLAPSPDGSAMASGDQIGDVHVWDLGEAHLMSFHKHAYIVNVAHPGNIHSLAFSPDGYTLAAGAGGEVVIWDLSPYFIPASRSADLDGDGTVGFADFVLFAQKYGHTRGQRGYDRRFDLDDDGEVGFGDFLIFAGAFGQGA